MADAGTGWPAQSCIELAEVTTGSKAFGVYDVSHSTGSFGTHRAMDKRALRRGPVAGRVRAIVGCSSRGRWNLPAQLDAITSGCSPGAAIGRAAFAHREARTITPIPITAHDDFLTPRSLAHGLPIAYCFDPTAGSFDHHAAFSNRVSSPSINSRAVSGRCRSGTPSDRNRSVTASNPPSSAASSTSHNASLPTT